MPHLTLIQSSARKKMVKAFSKEMEARTLKTSLGLTLAISLIRSALAKTQLQVILLIKERPVEEIQSTNQVYQTKLKTMVTVTMEAKIENKGQVELLSTTKQEVTMTNIVDLQPVKVIKPL